MRGVVADVVDRRWLMVITQSVMLLCSAILAFISFKGLEQAWPIFLLTAIASAAWAFDTPARQSLLPMLVPLHDFQNAVSLGMLMFQTGMITGPPLAGFVLASHGPGLVYLLNAGSFVAVIVGLALMRTSGKPEKTEAEQPRISFQALVEGLRFVWRTPIIVQTMTLDFVATFFAAANQLLPIYAKDILFVGARGYGFLAAAPAAGAIIAGLIVARMGAIKKQGVNVIVTVAIYGEASNSGAVVRLCCFLVLSVTGHVRVW